MYPEQDKCWPLIKKLKLGERVIFTKFGDGEYNCCINKHGKNCDNETYHSDLSELLKKSFIILCNTKNSFIGKWNNSIIYEYFSNLIIDKSTPIPFVHYHWLIHHFFPEGFERNDIIQLIEFIQKTDIKKIVITNNVGMKRMCKFLNSSNSFEVKSQNWSFDFYDVLKNVLEIIPIDIPSIVNISAGLASKPLIALCSQERPLASFLDWGSGLDSISRLESTRDYNKNYYDIRKFFDPVWNIDKKSEIKILFYQPGHHKNINALKNMASSFSINLEITTNYNRIIQNNYDILIANSTYVSPETIPENIKIIYGPQHFIFPNGQIVGELNVKYSKRCVYNCLSEWINDLFQEIATLKIPKYSFPFSIDTELFKPDISIEKNIDCIIYIKNRCKHLINNVINTVNHKKLTYHIFTYGSYEESDYIKTLHKAKFMICIDAHESQGFALEEAMSMNVPLLVLDVMSMFDEKPNGINSTYEYLKPKKLLATSVPYWSDNCGIKIQSEDIHIISKEIDNMLLNYNTYNPRNYIIETLSPRVCMERILKYFDLI